MNALEYLEKKGIVWRDKNYGKDGYTNMGEVQLPVEVVESLREFVELKITPSVCPKCGHPLAMMEGMLGHFSLMPLIGAPLISHLCMTPGCTCEEPEG